MPLALSQHAEGEVGTKDKSSGMEEGDPSKSERAPLAQALFLLEAWVLPALGSYASCCNCAKGS